MTISPTKYSKPMGDIHLVYALFNFITSYNLTWDPFDPYMLI